MIERGTARNSLDLDPIAFCFAGRRVSNFVLEGPIICQDQQTLTVSVQTASCINFGDVDVVGEARASVWISKGAQYTEGFVE
jgi:hypothetical protein